MISLSKDKSKEYLKCFDVIKKVCSLYSYNEILSNSLNVDSKEYFSRYYYFLANDNNESLNYSVLIEAKPYNEHILCDILALTNAIFKAFKFKETVFEFNFKNNLNTIINEMQIPNEYIESNDKEIIFTYSNQQKQYNFGFGKIFNDSIQIFINIEQILLAINDADRTIIKDDNAYIYFIPESKNLVFECIKQANILRIGGLSTDIDYLFTNIEDSVLKAKKLNSRFVCLLTNEQMNQYNINIMDMLSGSEEVISIYELYPYIINKNKSLSGCLSCKEKEK